MSIQRLIVFLQLKTLEFHDTRLCYIINVNHLEMKNPITIFMGLK